MTTNLNVRVSTLGTLVTTEGLARGGYREVVVDTGDRALTAEGEAFLRAIVNHLIETRSVLKPEETFRYGYWLTLFKAAGNDTLEVWEHAADASHFVPGAKLTLTYWRDQQSVCAKYGAAFMPPRPDKLAVVSAGVFEGDPVQGIRYPSPEHMSGWWFTTDRYDGNMKSLRTEHLYHVTAARPDLARYVALPYGFRFDLSKGEDVWFEEKIASQPQD